MELDSYEIGVHIYSIIIIIPTLLFNLLVLYLIFKQTWEHNLLERNIILFIVLSDIIFSSSIIIRYIIGFCNNVNIFKIVVNNVNFNLVDCNWSGFLLMVTMHSTTYMLGVLSYVRYNSIVNQSNEIGYIKLALLLSPLFIILICAIYGVINLLFIEMPGGLACHIWAPTLNDPKRTPIQIILAYNILISLIFISVCYIKIAIFHINCLKSFLNRPSITILRANLPKPQYPHPYELEELKYDRQSNTSNNLTIQKYDKISQIKHQGYKVTFRILVILLIIYICFLPELLLEQMEILLGRTRSKFLDGICTHFRSGYGLANALLLLFLHTKTRKQFFLLINKIVGKSTESTELSWKQRLRASFKRNRN